MNLLSKLFVAASVILLPCLSHAHNEFKLSDFAGNYTSYSSSAGGSTNPTGNSAASVAQFTLDKCGTGTVNFVSLTFFSASSPVTTTLETSIPLAINYSLSIPNIGVGHVFVDNVPTPGSTLNASFVATKSHRHKRGEGNVAEILFNVTGNTGVAPASFTSPTTINAHRQ